MLSQQLVVAIISWFVVTSSRKSLLVSTEKVVSPVSSRQITSPLACQLSLQAQHYVFKVAPQVCVFIFIFFFVVFS